MVAELKATRKEVAEMTIDEVFGFLASTRNFGKQGTREYVAAQAQRLVDSPSSTPGMKRAGEGIMRAMSEAPDGDIKRMLLIMDEELELHGFDLNFWEMYFW